MSAEDAAAEAWEGVQIDYRAAVGTLALRAAELEHLLYEAVASAFDEGRDRANVIVRGLNADKLRTAFVELFSGLPTIVDLGREIRRLFEARNEIMHGLALEYEPHGASVRNRRRPGEPRRLATIAELDRLSEDFNKASERVAFASMAGFLRRLEEKNAKPPPPAFS